MKDHYERYPDRDVWFCRFFGWRTAPSRLAGKYRVRYAGQHRYPRSFNEERQLRGFEADGMSVRRRRLNTPDCRDDINISRAYGRSWKDYTKQRHQWEKR